MEGQLKRAGTQRAQMTGCRSSGRSPTADGMVTQCGDLHVDGGTPGERVSKDHHVRRQLRLQAKRARKREGSPLASERSSAPLMAQACLDAYAENERPRREVVRAGASLPEITLGGSNRAVRAGRGARRWAVLYGPSPSNKLSDPPLDSRKDDRSRWTGVIHHLTAKPADIHLLDSTE